MGIFVYDSSKKNLFESIYVITDNRRLKRALKVMMRTPGFIDNNKTPRKLPDDREIFFREYIPRVLKLKEGVEELEMDEEFVIDDSLLYRMEIEFWRDYYRNLIENSDKDEEKNFYQDLLQEKEDELEWHVNPKLKGVVYFQVINGSRFYYDTNETNLDFAIWAEGSEGFQSMLFTMLKAPKFMGRDRKLHETDKERELFFMEYMPRVFGKPSDVGIVDDSHRYKDNAIS